MIVCRNKRSKKFFIYLSDTDWDNIKVITPLSQIKTVERSLFKEEREVLESDLLENQLITKGQHKVYRDYLMRREIENFEKDSDGAIGQEDSASSNSQKIIKAEGKVMKNIEIDDEVYAYLQNKAIPFQEHNPNDVIRRLLGVKSKPVKAVSIPAPTKSNGLKAPKADLLKLVELGRLQEGQTLFFSPEGQTLSKKYEAKIAGKRLNYQGNIHAMSKLVKIILENEGLGNPSGSYRGPKHWITSDGVSVMELWEQYLKEVHDA
jgi:predicted CopG family antitoxin